MRLTIEDALDYLRAEGYGTPDWLPHPPSQDPAGPAGRFVNQCGRCLEFKQASVVNLTRSQRIWLCEACSGPNPPAVVFEKPKTWAQIQRDKKAALKLLEKERKKAEREAKKRDNSLHRVRRKRVPPGKPEDAQPEGSEGSDVRV